ncbi:MAG: iron complex outermembrane receptor protein, partial [Congregibacter sp.]
MPCVISADPNGDPDAYERYLALMSAGVVGAESIGGVNYFQNAIDTETTGFDLVANYAMLWDGERSTDLSLALNYHEQEVVADTLGVLNAEDKFDLENQLPNLRWNAIAFHTAGDFSIMARARYFGESEDSDNTSPLSVQTYDPAIFLDLEGSLQINDMLRASIGGRNIFDEYPDKVDRIASNNDYCCGRVYASTSVVDWQGGYYYLRLRA